MPRDIFSLQSMRSATAMAVAASALMGCDPITQQAAVVSPAAPPLTPPPVAAPEPSMAESEAVRRYFRTQQESLLARGLMRTDGGGTDTPVTVNMLVENFVRIALYDEYAEVNGQLVARSSPAPLRRWQEPVRMYLQFAPGVPEEMRRQDRADITEYIARLSRLSGNPISLVSSASAANFHILVLDETTRRGYADELRTLVPGIDALSLRTITDMPRTASCLVVAFTRGSSHNYSRAVAVIRSELPDLTRLSCYHEELAQGLGLPNDSNMARPSIFNDIQEFAYLTRHDEYLLRILYDPRLLPGMTEDEVRPIVQRIATELLGGEG